jgi:hypothetical protein
MRGSSTKYTSTPLKTNAREQYKIYINTSQDQCEGAEVWDKRFFRVTHMINVHHLVVTKAGRVRYPIYSVANRYTLNVHHCFPIVTFNFRVNYLTFKWRLCPSSLCFVTFRLVIVLYVLLQFLITPLESVTFFLLCIRHDEEIIIKGSNSCSTCSTHRFTLNTNPMVSHKWVRTALWLPQTEYLLGHCDYHRQNIY